MKPVVVTMVTDPTYTTWANKLMESCSRFGLVCMVIRRPDIGTWVENVAQKPSVILYAMHRIDDDIPVLWIDADAIILREPALLYEADTDFAIRKLDRRHRVWWPVGRPGPLALPDEWEGTDWFLTGTVYVGRSALGIQFLDRWCELAAADPRGYQQLVCQQAWCDVRPRTLWLPAEYCAIRRMDNTPEPVVSHELASTRGSGVVRA